MDRVNKFLKDPIVGSLGTLNQSQPASMTIKQRQDTQYSQAYPTVSNTIMMK